jgi:hypothetical protein
MYVRVISFFPFKSCCFCLRRRRSRCKSKHAFLFCLSFYLQGDIQCQLLPFDRRQSPPGQNKFEKKKNPEWGKGRKNPSAPMLGCRVSIPWATTSQTYTTHLPTYKNRHLPFYPPGPGRLARRRQGHPPRAPLVFAVHAVWLAYPVCRPHTTGAVFL